MALNIIFKIPLNDTLHGCECMENDDNTINCDPSFAARGVYPSNEDIDLNGHKKHI
jgi:hypothetical protein